MTQETSFVYILPTYDGMMKIGKADIMDNRVATLDKLYIFNYNKTVKVECDKDYVLKLERMLHIYFEEFNLNLVGLEGITEMFSLDIYTNVLDFIATIIKGNNKVHKISKYKPTLNERKEVITQKKKSIPKKINMINYTHYNQIMDYITNSTAHNNTKQIQYTTIIFLFFTGIKGVYLNSLKQQDLLNLITFKTLEKEDFTLVVDDTFIDAIKKYKIEYMNVEKYLIVTQRGTKIDRLGQNSFIRLGNTLMREALGKDGFSMGSFRIAFIGEMFINGYSVEQIATQLRASPQSIEKYISQYELVAPEVKPFTRQLHGVQYD